MRSLETPAETHGAHPLEHGPFHDLRQHLTEAVVHGDLQKIHLLIAEAERHHHVPPHVGLFLDLRAKPWRNTHQGHTELAHAINEALALAKEYRGLKAMFAEMDQTVPKGEIRPPLRAELATALAPLADEFSQAPPGAARDQAEQLLRDLLEMI